ncbi:MAG: alpha/beta hydrolase [Ruminococcaceae bacterium]|nr:alpha/beta hydrolase [Oscillospiraceae bacterium]
MRTAITLWNDVIPYNSVDAPVPNLLEFYPAGEGKRPCVLVLPGGGYSTCNAEGHEGRAIAEYVNAYGYHAAVLTYRLVPHRYPAALSDAQRAMKLLRHRAEELGIIPDKIVSMGFSAGGNLSASLGVLPDEAKIGDELDDISPVPNGCVMGYPAIDLHDPQIASGRSLFAERLPEFVEEFSLQNRVTDKTPPCFLWHTSDDNGVGSQHSLLFALALKEHKIPYELHIYPHGRHGLGLAKDKPDVSGWANLALDWIRRTI